jgi:predicted dehydrogenase
MPTRWLAKKLNPGSVTGVFEEDMVDDKQSEYPGGIQNLFQQCRHSRRDFVAGAGKFAVGGLAAAAIFDALTAGSVQAQESTTSRPVQRVAVIGAGHYHFAEIYLKILLDRKVDIVGIHDPDPKVAADLAKRCNNSTPYTDYKLMCEKTNPEFVLTLSKHYQMPEPIRYLIEAGIPFMGEKPWGIDPRTVNDLAELADKKKAWATFPASMRYSTWAVNTKKMAASGELGTISHFVVRFNQPGVQRYIDQGNQWMLSKKEAGGGALINLGIHGFDLCRWITGEEPIVVSAATSHAIAKLEIEDYAFVTLRTPSGIIFLNEAGYTYPGKGGGGDAERKLVAEKVLIRGASSLSSDDAQVIRPDRNEEIKPTAGYIDGWPGAVNDALDRLGRGEPPAATAHDNARAVELIFDSYRLAGEKIS